MALLANLKTILSSTLSTFNLQLTNFSRKAKPSENLMKVTLIGAAGKLGQGLSLLLKQSPLIDELRIHDIKPTEAFGLELSQVDTNCRVKTFSGDKSIEEAIKGANVLVVLAAKKDSNVLPIGQQFEKNAPIVKDIAQAIGRSDEKPLIAIATNPINSIVPMVSEILNQCERYDPRTVFGVTSIDVVRANTFVAKMLNAQPECVLVPVIGGHSEETIVPILSHCKPCYEFSNDEVENITNSVRQAHNKMTKLEPKSNAPFSGAFAIARFVISLVKGLKGYQDIVECAYVHSCVIPNLKYCATPILLGKQGIQKDLGLPKLNSYEQCLFRNAILNLIYDIKVGEDFVRIKGMKDPEDPPCNPCDPSLYAPKCPPDHCQKAKDSKKQCGY